MDVQTGTEHRAWANRGGGIIINGVLSNNSEHELFLPVFKTSDRYRTGSVALGISSTQPIDLVNSVVIVKDGQLVTNRSEFAGYYLKPGDSTSFTLASTSIGVFDAASFDLEVHWQIAVASEPEPVNHQTILHFARTGSFKYWDRRHINWKLLSPQFRAFS